MNSFLNIGLTDVDWHNVAMLSIGCLICFCLSTAIVLLTARRTLRQVSELETRLLTAQSELAKTTAFGLRTGKRLRRLKHDYQGTLARLAALELRVVERPYDQAIEWAQRGADADALRRTFGLSRGEADLVSHMHSRRKTA
jgi:Protein of unknown function (DUF2802)